MSSWLSNSEEQRFRAAAQHCRERALARKDDPAAAARWLETAAQYDALAEREVEMARRPSLAVRMQQELARQSQAPAAPSASDVRSRTPDASLRLTRP
jgi:hypothetical protein